MTKLIVVILASLAIAQLQASISDSRLVMIDPDKAEYRVRRPYSEKYKFGYEINENKHFHHTTQDEDGVRLGCYGFVLEGKKYSTQYVADCKGYRVIHNQDLITVYPTSGGERKASFNRELKEDERLSQNIRFFFPEGCQSEDVVPEESRIPTVTALPNTPLTVRPFITTTTPRPIKIPGPAPAPTTTEAPSTCPKPKCTCTCVQPTRLTTFDVI